MGTGDTVCARTQRVAMATSRKANIGDLIWAMRNVECRMVDVGVKGREIEGDAALYCRRAPMGPESEFNYRFSVNEKRRR